MVQKHIYTATLPAPYMQARRTPITPAIPEDSGIVTEFDPETVPVGQSLFFAA